MRTSLFPVLLSSALLMTPSAHAQSAGPTDLSGKWIVTADFFGTPRHMRLELKQDGGNLTGSFSGDKLEGTVTGETVRFLAKDEEGGSEQFEGTVERDSLSGSIRWTDATNPMHPHTHSFTASRVPPRPGRAPQRHQFVPTTFYRQFSPIPKPVLTIAPGDSVETRTVDAGGTDEKNEVRVLGGNPQTGPFYVESAMPGDTLVVRLDRVRLNRDWAISDDYIVDRAQDGEIARQAKDLGKPVRWHLDVRRGVATPEKPGEHMKEYSVPVRPMLGCVGVATRSEQAPPGTGDSGRHGGNMDFNEVVEGATVYLPVNVPGAYLYLGDGHAAQGDGETTGNALETSMDVQFTVDVIPGKSLPSPRVESSTHIIAMGLAGSLDAAFRDATANMFSWLTDAYKLTPSEIAQVLGTAAEYTVSEVADRNVGMVLKINKERLKGLTADSGTGEKK